MSMEQQPNPILLSFPDQFQTERLTIRAPQWGMGRQSMRRCERVRMNCGLGFRLQEIFLRQRNLKSVRAKPDLNFWIGLI